MSAPSKPIQSPAVRAYLQAVEASRKACEARGRLPHGSSRAKVTTANARWARAAEHRDRLAERLTPDERESVGLPR